VEGQFQTKRKWFRMRPDESFNETSCRQFDGPALLYHQRKTAAIVASFDLRAAAILQWVDMV
jgi:hypothetical protein